MATMDIPAIGYGLRYDYGIFKQVIKDGGMRNPMHYRAERDPRRWAKVLAAGVSYDRKFRTYYDPQAAAQDRG